MDPTKLRDVRRIISHANCPDGIASAWLCKRALPEAEVEFVSYYDDTLRYLHASSGMLFCDMSPPRERADDFLDLGAIVLDHHVTQQDVVMRFASKGLGAFGVAPGVSGAVLAYQHVYLPIRMARLFADACRGHETSTDLAWLEKASEIARLVGIYDTWQREHDDWEEACATTSVLMFYGFEGFKHRPHVALHPEEVHLGVKLHGDRLDRARHAVAERLVIVPVGGRRGPTAWGEMAFFNDDYHDPLSSLVGERAREVRADDHTLANVKATVAYRLEPWSYRYSIRQVDPDFDCSRLAKALGGGGHVGAAGISFDKVEEKLHPIELFCQRAAATEDVQ